ncbi:hypothetical protein JMM81_19395 [Bacillus sp. V3B]|uniref:hypothetical protein n=1 Tax=Bacillus sp. V3B TaxID=2804915 RepID=UPI0021093EAD|nr:hypothetical protein [Bacillus sp. V3B]MCQ6277045.1 hypothetical protein [Bacillus sp. V3B]
MKIIIEELDLVGVFAGCSNAEKSSAEDTPKETTTEDTATESTGELKIGRVNSAPHGDKSFAVTVVAMDGDKIAVASIDEFQFLSTEEAGVIGVPNSDGAFAENFVDPKVVLASKVDSTEYYSAHMVEAAGSTVAIHDNYAAIEEYVTGKTIAELEEELGKYTTDEDKAKMIDVVSGATLADTHGYVTTFVEAAK